MILQQDTVIEKKHYFQDEKGKWWYKPPKMRFRYGAEIFNCVSCGKLSVKVKNKKKHTEKFYCSRACAAREGGGLRGMVGKFHYAWKGGRRIERRGYVLLYNPDHPHCESGKYVREHRLVMEKSLGRYLQPFEYVHHKNGIKSDNRLENLQLVNTHNHEGEVQCPHCLKTFLIR